MNVASRSGVGLAALAVAAALSGCQVYSQAARLIETQAVGPWRAPETELADRLLDDIGYDRRGIGRGEVLLSDAPLHRRLHVLAGMPAEWVAQTNRAEERMTSSTASSTETIGRTAVETPSTRRRSAMVQLASREPTQRASGLFALEPAMLAHAKAPLAGALDDPDPVVRAEAARAIARLGAIELAGPLAARLRREADELAACAELEALAVVDPTAGARMARQLADGAAFTLLRAQAVEIIARLPGPDRAARLVDRVEHDASMMVRDLAARALERLTGQELPASAGLGSPLDPELVRALRAWDSRPAGESPTEPD